MARLNIVIERDNCDGTLIEIVAYEDGKQWVGTLHRAPAGDING